MTGRGIPNAFKGLADDVLTSGQERTLCIAADRRGTDAPTNLAETPTDRPRVPSLMVTTDAETSPWTSPLWLIPTASVSIGVFTGLFSVVLGHWSSDQLTGWSAFLVGLFGVGGANAASMVRHRRRRLRGDRS